MTFKRKDVDPIVFDGVCIVVTVLMLALRLYIRKTMVKKVWLDDWLLVAAVIFFVISCALDATCWILSAQGDRTQMAAQVGTIDIFPYLVAEILVRAAYAVFYLRVMPAQLGLRWHRRIVIFVLVVYTLWQTMAAFLYLFACGSPANIGNPDAKCLSQALQSRIFQGTYFLDALVDWLMALMAIDVVRRSTMSHRTKLSVAPVLGLGCLTSVIAIVLIPLSRADGLAVMVTDMLATAETFLAIVCLCLAAYKPLLNKWLDGTNADSDRSPEMGDAAPGSGSTVVQVRMFGDHNGHTAQGERPRVDSAIMKSEV